MLPLVLLLLGHCVGSTIDQAENTNVSLNEFVSRLPPFNPVVFDVVSSLFTFDSHGPRILDYDVTVKSKTMGRHKKTLYDIESDVLIIYTLVKAHYTNILRFLVAKSDESATAAMHCSDAILSRISEENAQIAVLKKALLTRLVAARRQTQALLGDDRNSFNHRLAAGTEIVCRDSPGLELLAKQVYLFVETATIEKKLAMIRNYFKPGESPTTYILRSDSELFNRLVALGSDRDQIDELYLAYSKAFTDFCTQRDRMLSINFSEQQIAFDIICLNNRYDVVKQVVAPFYAGNLGDVDLLALSTCHAIIQSTILGNYLMETRVSAGMGTEDLDAAAGASPEWQEGQQLAAIEALRGEEIVLIIPVEEPAFDAELLNVTMEAILQHHRDVFSRFVSPSHSAGSVQAGAVASRIDWRLSAVVSRIDANAHTPGATEAVICEVTTIINSSSCLAAAIESTRNAMSGATKASADMQAKYNALVKKHNSNLKAVADYDASLEVLLTQIDQFTARPGVNINAKQSAKLNRAVHSFQTTLPLLESLLSEDAALCTAIQETARMASIAAAREYAFKNVMVILQRMARRF